MKTTPATTLTDRLRARREALEARIASRRAALEKSLAPSVAEREDIDRMLHALQPVVVPSVFMPITPTLPASVAETQQVPGFLHKRKPSEDELMQLKVE